MNDQLMTLSKIFTERIFRIPDYQRGYAWTEKEVSEFWNDLCRLNNNSNHYVGVLTLEPVKEDTYKLSVFSKANLRRQQERYWLTARDNLYFKPNKCRCFF